MSALSVQVPFPVFQDRDGQPLDNGYVWIGEPSLNPQTNPVVAYYDAALTIVAAQPLRTINGYISRSGTPAQIYVNGVNFSILVQDSKGSMVYNFPNATGISPDACGVTYDPPFTGSVPYPVCEKLAQTVSVMDFGAVADGVTDDTDAIQAAIDAMNAAGGGMVNFPAGTYACANIWPKDNVTLQGEGSNASKLINNSPEYSIITTWRLAPGSVQPALGNYAGSAPRTSNFNVDGLLLDGQYDINPDNGDDNHQHGVYLFKTTNCSVTNCLIQNIWYVGVESYLDCFDNQINSNTFIDVGNKPTIVGPTGFYYGIGLDNGAIRCEAKWNYFNDCGHAINKITDFYLSEDCVIEGNTFGSLDGLFLTHRNGASRLVVRNNTGNTCGSGFISITAEASTESGGGYCDSPVIVGNQCNDFNTSNGASVSGISITANGHKIVRGNVVRHAVTAAVRGCIGLNMNGPAPSGSCSSQVEENYFEGDFPNFEAIRFNAETDFIERNNSINGQGTADGIFVASTSSDGQVCIGTQFIDVASQVENLSTTTKVFNILQNYTPVVTAASGGFVLGNGSTSGEFVYLTERLVEVYGTINIGTTTVLGAGALLITLPKNHDGSEQIGSFLLLNGASGLAGASRARPDNNLDLFAPSQVSGASPVAIGSGAIIRYSLIYKTSV